MADAEANEKPGTEKGSQERAAGDETTEEKDTNPLLPDLRKWKERARAAEQQLADREADARETARQRELAEAKTKEDLEAIKAKYEAEYRKQTRALEITRAAANAGIHEAFVRFVDDGKLSPAEVVEAAKAKQEAYDERIRTGTSTESFGGGTSPGRTGKKVWTREEIEALDPYAEDYPRDEIAAALREGRYKE